MKKQYGVLTKERIVLVMPNGKMIKKTEQVDVEIMATVGNYSMVRRARRLPFVADSRKIKPKSTTV